MSDWVDLVARVRGLATRRLTRDQLGVIGGSRDLASCSVALAAAGILPAPLEHAGAAVLEQGIRRHAGQELAVLARWAGPRLGLLAPLYEDEDRRSIRAMLRGAHTGSAPEGRLAGLVPTPLLPERGLVDLTRRGDVRSVVAQLSAMSHPFASALLEEASRQHPDLLGLEHALNRRFAERAVAAAARSDAAMRSYVAAVLDVENAWTARLLPLGDVDAASYVLEGGRDLPVERVMTAVTAPTASQRDAVLRGAATTAWLRAAVAEGPGVEVNVLRALIAHQRAVARCQPLGTAPIIEYVLRLRAQVRALQRIVWSIALAVPAAHIADALELVP